MSETELLCGDCLELMRGMRDNFVNLVIGSPPYHGKMRRYSEGSTKRGKRVTEHEWSDWMLEVVRESVRVSGGKVIFVVNGEVRKGRYAPACERLLVKCADAGIPVERPVIWTKNATPSRKDWFSNQWEFVYAFGDTKTWNWREIAKPPKYEKGGAFRQRSANGKRVTGSAYPKGDLARPFDVLRVTVGGGHMGHKLAHENEAPYPCKLVEPFVKSLTNAGDIVLDPFAGSGTTLQVAKELGRHSIGIDNRQSQIELMEKRLADG